MVQITAEGAVHERRCRADDATTAFTVPGSRVVHVCVDRFAERFAVKTRDGELLILHELLHTLTPRLRAPPATVVRLRYYLCRDEAVARDP
jgi:hypothetical protein